MMNHVKLSFSFIPIAMYIYTIHIAQTLLSYIFVIFPTNYWIHCNWAARSYFWKVDQKLKKDCLLFKDIKRFAKNIKFDLLVWGMDGCKHNTVIHIQSTSFKENIFFTERNLILEIRNIFKFHHVLLYHRWRQS